MLPTVKFFTPRFWKSPGIIYVFTSLLIIFHKLRLQDEVDRWSKNVHILTT